MEKKVENKLGVTVITLEGELDIYNSAELKSAIQHELSVGAKKLLLDLNEVGYVDSAALGVLVGGLKRAKQEQAALKLLSVKGPVEKIFKLTKLNEFFDIYTCEDEALASFN